ncbi:TrmO family methyltransferase [Myxococcota bacterium]
MIRRRDSRIVLDELFAERLFRIEEWSHLQIIFGLQQPLHGYAHEGPVHTGETKGVFASQRPFPPSRLGVTTAELIGVEGNSLAVRGLGALDGAPVYDIKPHRSIFDEQEQSQKAAANDVLAYPRGEIARLVRAKAMEECLTIAGRFHGHYCPGLALGVYAAVEAMDRMSCVGSDGMERLLAIVEVNSCFADGVQVVTGCTFGNNALVYQDYGKTAVTLVTRSDGRGSRVSTKPGFQKLLHQAYPEFSKLFDKVVKQRSGTEVEMADFRTKARETGFGVLSYSADTLFDFKDVTLEVPAYAPIVESVICCQCDEQLMETKAVRGPRGIVCRGCAEMRGPRLTGSGIEC